MKVIQINASYKPAFIYGGPTMSVSKLSEVLAKDKQDIEVLTTSANGAEELNIQPGEPVIVDNVPIIYFKRLTKDHTHFSPALYIALWNKLTGSKSQQTIVHIHTWWNLVSVLSCLVALIKKIPVVLSPRGTLSSYSFGNKNNFFKSIIFALSNPMLKRCHLHATSENEKKALLTLISPRSITVIPNIVSLPKQGLKVESSGFWEEKQKSRVESRKSRSERQEGEDKLKLLFLSRIEEKKGLELLFSALKGIDLNYHLSIAGSGEDMYVDQLKELSESLGIDSRISWIGQQSADRKFEVMESHDLLVLPSYDENFANVVIESLAMGTAVLITENVGLSDYVKEQDLGWVCKFDRQDLKDSLILAAEDTMKLQCIRSIAPLKIREDFSDDRLVERYIEMYQSILDEDKQDLS